MAGLKYWIWLCECKGLTRRSRELLLARFGTPEEVYYADKEEYCLVDGLEKSQIELLKEKSTAEADRILGECQRLGIRILTMQDADYPARLRNIFDPPFVLYVKGNLPAIDEEAAFAMVGTRRATPYGIESAEALSYGLAKRGALVISGAARGIDTAAHRGALRAGRPTLAVLGCGIDVVYPEENAWLYRDIVAMGALISEYPPGTAAVGAHFPVRNRIISGLSVATIVVEAPEKSGALITANTALEQGRDIFAVPGPINAPNSRGCNRLIADGAGLAGDCDDILHSYIESYPNKLTETAFSPIRTLGYEQRQRERATKEAAKESAKAEAALPEQEKPALLLSASSGLTDDQIDVLRALREAELLVDEIVEQTEIPTRRVLSALTMLEIEGYVMQQSGKRFSLTVALQEE